MKYHVDGQMSNERETEKINHDKIESYLYDRMQVPEEPNVEKMQETIQLCIKEMRRQSSAYEERTGFWAYLSDIFRFEGISIFELQIIALLVSCLGISATAQIPEMIPTFMPLFGLALVPVLYRNQMYGMCEMEAVTRASGAQIVLAKLILAGAANLLCMTVIVCLEVFVAGGSDQIVQIILYVIVPFLVCMVELLRRIRVCKCGSIAACTTISLISCVAWRVSAKAFPWLYETSATGIWIVGFIVFTSFFIREIYFIIQKRREGRMYGTIS